MPTGRSTAEDNLSNTDASLWLSGETPPFGWWNRWMIAFSIISVLATLTVLMTFYLHWDHIAKGKLYPQMIFMIFVSQFLSNMCTVPGYPTTVDTCSAQGFLNQYFTRVTWTWCMSLACTLAYKLIMSQTGLTFLGLNVSIWGINLLIQMLPMITGDMPGLPVSYLGRGICSIGRDAGKGGAAWQNPDNENLMWYTITSTAPLFLTVIITLIAVLLIEIWVLPAARNLEDHESAVKIEQLINFVLPYPIGALVMWTPTLVVAMIVFILVSEENWQLLIDLPLVVPNIIFTLFFTLYGLYITVIFFWNSKESRRRNLLFLRKIGLLKANDDIPGSSSSSSSGGNTESSARRGSRNGLGLGDNNDDLLQLQADFEKDDEYAAITDTLRDTLRLSATSRLSAWTGGRRSSLAGSMPRDRDSRRVAEQGLNGNRLPKSGRFSLGDLYLGDRRPSDNPIRPSGLSDVNESDSRISEISDRPSTISVSTIGRGSTAGVEMNPRFTPDRV